MILGWVAAIFTFGGYRSRYFGDGHDEYKRLTKASLFTAAAVGIGCYLLASSLRAASCAGVSHRQPGAGPRPLPAPRSIHRARTIGALHHRVVIAGAEGHVDEIAAVLRREKWLGYDVIGALTPQRTERPCTASGIPILGSTGSVATIAVDAGVDVVFLAGGAVDSAAEMRQSAWYLEHEDIAVVIAPSVTDVSSERVRVRPVGGLPLIHLESHVPPKPYAGPSAPSTSSALWAFFCSSRRSSRSPHTGLEARPRADPVPPDSRRPRR